MEDNKSLKELAKQITSMCLIDYLHRGNKISNIEQYTHIYLEEYKTIYKNLTKDEIFSKKIDDLAKEIALVYIKIYLSLHPRSTQECINRFIKVYKSALLEIESEKTPKNTSVLPEYKPEEAKNREGLIFTSTKSPMSARSEDEEQLPEGLVKFRGMGISFGR